MSDKRRRQPPSEAPRHRISPAAFLLIAALTVSLISSALILRIPAPAQETASPEETAPAYDPSLPFSLSDLSAPQVRELRQKGSLQLSDGPRGISVGDSIDKIFSRYPVDIDGTISEEGQILYCAEYYPNANGVMTALPPRGILFEEDGREVVIILLSPTGAYPPGTADDYLRYEHVYCRYVVSPEDMRVSSIRIGLTRQ